MEVGLAVAFMLEVTTARGALTCPIRWRAQQHVGESTAERPMVRQRLEPRRPALLTTVAATTTTAATATPTAIGYAQINIDACSERIRAAVGPGHRRPVATNAWQPVWPNPRAERANTFVSLHPDPRHQGSDPTDREWLHEIKDDGYRPIVRREADRARPFARRGMTGPADFRSSVGRSESSRQAASCWLGVDKTN